MPSKEKGMDQFIRTGVFINERMTGTTAVLGVGPEKVVILCRKKNKTTIKMKTIG